MKKKVCFHNVTSFVQDIVVVPGAGPLIQTSSFLLASLSPWLRHLLQSAGEDVCLCLPSVSSHEVPSYLSLNFFRLSKSYFHRVVPAFKIISSSSFPAFNIISSLIFSGFQNHIFIDFFPVFKATFSVEFLPLCCAGPSRQDRRRAEVERGEKAENFINAEKF